MISPKSELRLARPEDDPDLRKILRENPMAGDISLTFEREPNYFAAAQVEAPEHQIIVAKDMDINRIVGMGARSIRPLYINGKATKLGYLSQFRIDKNYRAMRKHLTQAWQLFKELHQDGKSPFYYTRISEDNLPARRLLTRGLPGLPKYIEYTRMHTLAIYSRRKKRKINLPDGLDMSRGGKHTQTKIIKCLQRNLSRYQFAPHWDESLMFTPDHTPDLSPEDFFVVLDGETVVGCAALWDQGAFKQTVVREYSKRVKYFRWLINLITRAIGMPTLPAVNSKIKHAYVSHLAVDNDNPEIYKALLRGLFNHAVEQGYYYIMLGFCENHPSLEQTQKEYAHIDYKSIIYLVTWDMNSDPQAHLDDRLSAPEIAIL